MPINKNPLNLLNESLFKYLQEEKPSIMQSIMYEVEMFKHNHNGIPPEKIFVSYPLHDKIIASYRLYPNRKEAITLCGIPVQPYNCEEEEFYLAEKKGDVRRMFNDIKQIFKKEDDTK